MDAYPSELTSPPVPLVALVGQPQLHVGIGDYLRTQSLPRLHAIGIADLHSAAGTFGEATVAPWSTVGAVNSARKDACNL